ncbi:Cof-type HAD-IIB family hydrolase [Anoxybacteroides rupiense]|uniref:Cof-type HAD-IIB family hydrolase n=1 Tax=Anoxybacteroides rupiense TaxID=311460 RepID=UPI001F09877A|nr:Cof-type HAD-IIB family hydrolase [Anoxybacillus rupiensis]
MFIALDMDGTLLHSEGYISPRNKDAIKKAQDAGHIVAIATGRAYKDAYLPLERAGLHCPIIGLNGAMITLESGAVMSEVPLHRQAFIPTLEWVRTQPDLYCELYTNTAVYVGLHNREHLEALAYKVREEHPDLQRIVQKQFQQARVTYVEDISQVWHDDSLIVYKILIFSLNLHLLKEASFQFAKLPDVAVTSSHPNNIEINHQQATKGEAIKKLASYYGMELSDTVVVGDSLNDLPMFAVAGYRVAMGNAAEAVKQQSDSITATNDEDGVALILEELVQKGNVPRQRLV